MSFFDPTLDAKRVVSDWGALVGDLPKPLAEAIAVFDEAQWVEPPAGGLPVEKITAKNVEEAVTDLARSLTLEGTFTTAKNRVLDGLARRVLALAAEAVPDLLDRLEPEFNAAVAEFKAAVDGLPEDHSPAALIASGPSAVESYHRAVEAQAKLNRFSGWLNTLTGLPGFGGYADSVLRILRPSNRAEYKLLLDAGSRRDGSELNPLYVAAVEAGLPWQMNTPAEAQVIADEINSQPVERKPQGFLVLR